MPIRSMTSKQKRRAKSRLLPMVRRLRFARTEVKITRRTLRAAKQDRNWKAIRHMSEGLTPEQALLSTRRVDRNIVRSAANARANYRKLIKENSVLKDRLRKNRGE